jgi:hypothetical protein
MRTAHGYRYRPHRRGIEITAALAAGFCSTPAFTLLVYSLSKRKLLGGLAANSPAGGASVGMAMVGDSQAAMAELLGCGQEN